MSWDYGNWQANSEAAYHNRIIENAKGKSIERETELYLKRISKISGAEIHRIAIPDPAYSLLKRAQPAAFNLLRILRYLPK